MKRMIIISICLFLFCTDYDKRISENEEAIRKNRSSLIQTAKDLDRKIRDNEDGIDKNETMIVDNFQALHDSVAQLRWDIQKYYIADSLVGIRSDIDSLREDLRKLETNIVSYYYLDSVRVIQIKGPEYTYFWAHNFEDVDNNDIQKLHFEMGVEAYFTDTAAVAGVGSRDEWQGFRTAEFRKENAVSIYTPEGWAYIFSTPIYGLEVDKFYVISVRAKEPGMSSEWSRSTDPPADWWSDINGNEAGRFVVTRVK